MKYFAHYSIFSLKTKDQAALAYNYGIMDGAIESSEKKSSDEVLQKDVERDTIKEKEQEGVENEREEDSVRLRNGGERDGGQDPGGQISRVEGGAGQIESRRKNKNRHQPRDSEAASLTYGKEVSAQSLGIEGGLEVGKVHLVAEGSETAEMKKARERAESRGIELVFFAGGNLRVNIDGKIASVRGYVQGNKIFVRADHYAYTSDQLVRHEICHDMIERGEISTEEIRAIVESNYDKAALDIIIAAYKEAYEGTGYSLDQIWEEIICDSFGEMNDLAEFSDHVGDMNVEFLQTIYKEIRANVKSERGPPKSVQGKASRETSDYLIYNFSGSVREESGITLSNNIKARIASAIKSGYGTLNKSHTRGRVYLSDICNCYIFYFNADGSITVKDILNTDEDSAVISIIEEKTNGNRAGKRDNTALSWYLERFRNGQGHHNNNNRGNVSSNRIDVQTDELYIGSSDHHGRRSGDGSGKINTNHAQVNSHLPIKHKFVDITGQHRNVLGIGDGQYMVQDTKKVNYKFNSIEEAISAENENIIQRYARKNNRSVTWVKNKLAEDSDFLARERRKGKASQDLDFFDYLNENAEDAEITESETIEEHELSNREFLANALESQADIPEG